MLSELKIAWEGLSSLSVSWLATFLIHSTLLLGAAWLLTRRPGLYRLRDVLWKTALIASLLTTSVHVFLGPVSAAGHSDLPGREIVAVEPQLIAPDRTPAPLPDSDADVNLVETLSHFGLTAANAAVRAWTATVGLLQNQAGWILMVWLLGAAVAGLRYASARRNFLAGVGQRQDVPPGVLTGILAQLCRQTRLRRCPRLTCSSHSARPMVIGPAEICIPQQVFTRLSVEQQRGLLAHELAHLVRRDPWWLLLSGILEHLLFFQPLVRLARRAMQESAEYLCDAQSARSMGDGLELAACLVEVAGWPRDSQPMLAAGMANGGSDLEARVLRLIDGSWANRSEGAGWWRAGLAAALFTCMVWAGPGVSVLAETQSPSQPLAMPVLKAVQPIPAPVQTATPIEVETGWHAPVRSTPVPTSAPVQATPPAPDQTASLLWPVQGYITRSYSEEHAALDIAAREGTPVWAVDSGTVVSAGWDEEGYGNVMLIAHPDGKYSFYTHLSASHVEVGQQVEEGQVIAAVGNTGRSTGPHLHFELTQNGKKLNPLLFLPDRD